MIDGGFGNLSIVDCDEPDLLAVIIKDLPKSFTVKTGSGGIHVYFIIEDLKKKLLLVLEKIIREKYKIGVLKLLVLVLYILMEINIQ